MDLSVCVVSFNTRDALAETVDAALADSRGLSAEVIVVDNGSDDGSPEMLAVDFPSVCRIVNQENRVFSAAANQAIRVASGRYVLALNSDAKVLPGTLPAMVDFLDSRPEIGAVTTQMYSPDGRLQRTCAQFWSFERLLLDFSFLRWLLGKRRVRLADSAWYSDWDRTSDRLVDVAPSSFLVTRQSVLDNVGAFDERLRLYFCDDDWCLRLKRSGGQLMFVAAGGVIHPEGTSARRVPAFARRLFFEDMLAYTARHFGARRARMLAVLTWPTRMAMAATAAVRGG